MNQDHPAIGWTGFFIPANFLALIATGPDNRKFGMTHVGNAEETERPAAVRIARDVTGLVSMSRNLHPK